MDADAAAEMHEAAEMLAEMGIDAALARAVADAQARGAGSLNKASRQRGIGRQAMQTGIRCMLMRGGTSKGAYFLADDLPADIAARDRILLAAMGSPDPRQVDGIGGAHPLTSKVAIVSRSKLARLRYRLSVRPGRRSTTPIVDTTPNCGNILAGVGPFAIERGLIDGERWPDAA